MRIGILGATGYVGQELVRILSGHKEAEIVKVYSDTYQNQDYAKIYRNYTGVQPMKCQAVEYETIGEGIDVLFTALPYGVLMQHMNQEILNQVRVIDLGVDYRFQEKALFLKYYGKEHESMELVSQFVYGLTEWNRKAIKHARHIANPGCFATAMQLALLPVWEAGIINERIIVDGKTSYSASGRTLTVGTHYAEANESVKPYKIRKHPHEAECMLGMELFVQQRPKVMFVPHIVPMQRGLLVTCYTELKQPMTEKEVRSIYEKYYGKEAFVQLLDPGMYVETKWVRNSNQCHINLTVDEEGSQLVIFAAIDNLIKGAAGQAVQNMNLMFGIHEETGIDFLPNCL